MMEPSYIIEQYERNAPFYANGGGLTVTGGEIFTAALSITGGHYSNGLAEGQTAGQISCIFVP